MKPKQQEKTKNATCRLTQDTWQQMNRKQRREMTRKIQSEDISLEVIHPNAAGIDIGNESHYVAVPPTRASDPVHRFGCTTGRTEGDGGLAEAMCDSDRRDAINWRLLDRGIRHSRTSWSGSVPGKCAGHEEPTRAQKRRAGESMADEAAHLWAVAKFVSAVAGDPHDADLLAAAQ